MSPRKYSRQQKIYADAGWDPEAELVEGPMRKVIDDVKGMKAAERAEFAAKVSEAKGEKP